jgi:hypothetical protein
LVTLKAVAKHKLLFNKVAAETEAGLLIKCSCLAAALGVTKFETIIAIFLVTLLKSDLDVQQTHLLFAEVGMLNI